MNPLAMVAQGADKVPVPVVSFPIAEDIHRCVVSVIADDAVIHVVSPVELPWRIWPVVACIAGRISGNDAVPEVVVIKVDEVPFETANDPLVNEPTFDVAPAVDVMFWVLVSSVEMRVSISKPLVKNDARTALEAPNDVVPVPALEETATGMLM